MMCKIRVIFALQAAGHAMCAMNPDVMVSTAVR
jgi:hypothetical protein